MKKLLFLILIIGIAADSASAAKSQTSSGEKSTIIGPKIFAGASCIVGYDDPDFSYGAGMRFMYYVPGTIYGVFGDAEFNHRGGVHYTGFKPDLNYLDFNFGSMIGKEFFFGAGLYLGILLSKNPDFTDTASGVDFGGIITFGYMFQTNPKFIIGFDYKVGFVDVYEAYDYYGNRKSVKNMTWGGFVGLGF